MPIASEPTSTLSPRSARPPTAGSSGRRSRPRTSPRAPGSTSGPMPRGSRRESTAPPTTRPSCPSRDPAARTLLLGSHLDSVKRGGRFDGALGVVCALEVLRVVQDAGLELPVTLEAIDFTDEEGTLIGTLGSLALAGRLTARRPGCAALRPRDPRRRARADGAHERRHPRRAPRPRLARRLPGAAHRAGAGARAGRHRHRDRHRHRRHGVVHGRVRGRGAPRRDDADGRPARCGRRRGGLRARRQGAGRPRLPRSGRHRR